MKHSGKANSIDEIRDLARCMLPRMVFDFIDGGSGSETTLRENRAALDKVKLVPSAPIDVSSRNQAVTLFGKPYAMPVLIGPTGLASIAWPDGERSLSRAAAAQGIPYVMSTAASSTMQEVADAGGGSNWFQLYAFRDRQVTLELVKRAEILGFEVLEVAVDNPIPGTRLRDSRNGFSVPFKWTPRKIVDVAMHPGWAARMWRSGAPEMKIVAEAFGNQEAATIAAVLQKQLDPGIDWDYIRLLRDAWPRSFVIKGMLDPAHVGRAIEAGVNGIVISNHGGRQLDGAVSTIEMLPEFVSESRGALELLIDSGFRTGVDIAKALALGAKAVQLGRPTLFALATGGQQAVEHALRLLKNEIDIAQGLLGAPTIADLSANMVRLPAR